MGWPPGSWPRNGPRRLPGDRSIALGLVHANETINFARASLFNLVFAGVTFILFGLAVALSDVYPRWLGWVVLVAGSARSGRA
jgi:hypothetical protein